jgi:hypothetical protein
MKLFNLCFNLLILKAFVTLGSIGLIFMVLFSPSSDNLFAMVISHGIQLLTGIIALHFATAGFIQVFKNLRGSRVILL